MSQTPYEVLEETHDRERAETALAELLFDRNSNPESISTVLKTHTTEYFDLQNLIDDVARRRLGLFEQYNRELSGEAFPDVLRSWAGDASKGTEQIYDIATGHSATPSAVERYQQKLRKRLPKEFLVVRGENSLTRDDPLQSWTRSVHRASLYADTLHTALAMPEDVFMSSVYGDSQIGEFEFVLTDYNHLDSYDDTIENFLIIYRQMQEHDN